jgi:hypothetical protein
MVIPAADAALRQLRYGRHHPGIDEIRAQAIGANE